MLQSMKMETIRRAASESEFIEVRPIYWNDTLWFVEVCNQYH